MIKGSIFVDDNMSNLTSASNEGVLSSSSNKNEIGTMYSLPINTNNNIQTQINKRKRNLPGNPDPESEVVALSPKSLMATNRFLCEICNKGFQRDQNLQLHRRGHNLPWKLKQRSKTEVVRKKVYVCPEPSCVHHEPSRALGDLTGIKKHFSRKHGEKKWKCEKCSKRYAVQSDWKAHSKICGTREYRCDCGTLFSRRDSFITHRAFCDALAEETARSSSSISLLPQNPHFPLNFPLKTEPPHLTNFTIINPTPSWLIDHHHHHPHHLQNPNPNLNSSTNNIHLPSPPPHMSATALLQKAAQMGVTMSKPTPFTSQYHHASSDDHHDHQGGMWSTCMDQIGASTSTPMHAYPHDHHQLLSHHVDSLTSTSIGSTTFEDVYNRILTSSKKDHHELTRDFLGLDHINTSSPFTHMMNMNHNNQNQNQNKTPWQG